MINDFYKKNFDSFMLNIFILIWFGMINKLLVQCDHFKSFKLHK